MRYTLVSIFLSLIFFLSSCDNELDVNADWQDVTVIYGMLNPNADTNYVRIQRGYLGKEPARDSYDKPDSLYYDTADIDVIINWFEINGRSRGELVGSAPLLEDFNVSLDDNGPFTTENYRLYRVPSSVPIVQNYEYEVRVIKANGEPDVYASTRIVNNFDIKQPNSLGNPPRFFGNLVWDNELNTNIYLYQPFFYFHYKEFDLITREEVSKVIEYKYKPVERKRSSSDYSSNFSPVDDFFNYIASNVPDDPNKLRFFEKIDFTIWGTDEVLTTYMNLKAPSDGINQNRPDYTNVVNGVGIFSSRIQETLEGAILSESGTPSMKDLLITKRVMCSKKFTTISQGDTCVCQDQGATVTLRCPYN